MVRREGEREGEKEARGRNASTIQFSLLALSPSFLFPLLPSFLPLFLEQEGSV